MNRVILSLFIILLFSCEQPEESSDKDSAEKNSAEKNKAIPVEVAEISEGEMPFLVNNTVVVQPGRESYVVSETQGKIIKVHFNLGSYVAAGAVLVETECGTQKAGLAQAQSTLQTAELNFKVASQLKESGQASQMEFLQAQAGVEGAKAAVAASEDLVDNCTVRAPFSGFIASKEPGIELGSLLGGGAVVARVVNTARLKATVFVSENEVVYIKKNMPVSVGIPAIPGHEFEAQVSAIGPASQPALPSFPVEISWRNQKKNNLSVRPGMKASISITTGSMMKSIVVPARAVVNVRGVVGVYLVRQGKAAFSAVETGRTREDQVEVLSGIKTGDALIISGLEKISSGVDVETTSRGPSHEVQ